MPNFYTKKTARAVSEKLKPDGYYSEVLPHQKVDINIIEKLQKEVTLLP